MNIYGRYECKVSEFCTRYYVLEKKGEVVIRTIGTVGGLTQVNSKNGKVCKLPTFTHTLEEAEELVKNKRKYGYKKSRRQL